MENTELRLEAYRDDEVKKALAKLFSYPEFLSALEAFLPKSLCEHILKEKDQIDTILDFQRNIVRPILLHIRDISMSDITSSGLEQLKPGEKYLFISNHRDIVLDSAFLNMILLKNGFSTCQIAIGDNLMQHQLSELLFRVNKSFVVKRSGTPRELYAYSIRLSEYIFQLVSKSNESVWIAQREGRAKDGNDRTQVGILKMFSLNKTTDLKNHFKKLKIVPVSISYEINPCDLLKTREHLRKRANPDYKKAFQDDVDYIFQGLRGQKGHVHFAFGSLLNQELEAFDHIQGEKKQLLHLTQQIDKVIHQNYRLHPINYVAHDLLKSRQSYSSHYTSAQMDTHKHYFEQQILQLKSEFQEEGRKYLLGIYANPLINAEGSREENEV